MDWLNVQKSADANIQESATANARGGAARLDQAAKFLEGCNQELTVDVSGNGVAQWQGKDVSHLGPDDIREILWELAEINFRLEFFALDQKLSSHHDEQHFDLIGGSFPHGKWNLLHCVQLGSANYGLAHSNYLERAAYVFSMRRCMQDWPGCPQNLSAASDQARYKPDDVERVETDIAAFYCDSFFMNFGRPPVLPRRLSHTPQVPYQPEVVSSVNTSGSGYVLDVSKRR